MAYQKQEWHDLPLEDTPISAERLTHMEQGIYDAWEHGGGGETLPVGSEIDFDGSAVPDGYEETDDPNTYSTTETIVGTWGNDVLYRKVLTGNMSQGSVNHNITNLKEIKRIYGVMHNNNTNKFFAIPSVRPVYPQYEIGVFVDGNLLSFETGSGAQESYMTFEIVLEYTKTTDEEEE